MRGKENMKKMQIGTSDIQGSVITLGAMPLGGGTWWQNSDDEEAIRTIHLAYDYGINLIDTAPVYGFGHSEELIGKAIKGRRSDFIISTKCGLWWEDEEGSFRFEKDGHKVRRNLSRRVIEQEIENSLKRLGTDYIDIYYPHNPSCPPFLTPVEETMDALLKLKQDGKIRCIGLSNATPDELTDYMRCGRIDIVQRKYNILDSAVEDQLFGLLKENKMSMHAYMPLERGLLTGCATMDTVCNKGDARDEEAWWKVERRPAVLRFLQELSKIAQQYSCSLGQLSIAYLLNQGSFVNVICGMRKTKHVEENALAAKISISEEDVKRIRTLADNLRAAV